MSVTRFKKKNCSPYTVFILIEARRASAGISPSDTVLISGVKIIVIKTPLTPCILQVVIVI